ncbi:MAG: transglutaminase domain-containing protein [Verrucomicrobia bacterium]|nr:transglutaminase domain-containing protein [Verrucomicrobiota bacterium]
MQAPATNKNKRPGCGQILARGAVKVFLFGILAALVLNPNLRIAYKQLRHTFEPERLIQPAFPSMQQVNRKIDRMIHDHPTGHSEVKIVERFVYKSVRYVSDYENWNNVEYWPSAEEVWHRRQEDCDGRAILAVSILRSRGYHSAKLVVGLNHMWATVNENEKEPSAPQQIVALLNPDANLSLEMEPKTRPAHFIRLAKALVQPTALRETSTGIIADIPNDRKLILGLLMILLWYLPLRTPIPLAKRNPS